MLEVEDDTVESPEPKAVISVPSPEGRKRTSDLFAIILTILGVVSVGWTAFGQIGDKGGTLIGYWGFLFLMWGLIRLGTGWDRVRG